MGELNADAFRALQGFVGCSSAWAGDTGVGHSRDSLIKALGAGHSRILWGYSGSRDCLELARDLFFWGYTGLHTDCWAV